MCFFRYQSSDHVECFHWLGTPSRQCWGTGTSTLVYPAQVFCFLNRNSSCQAKIRFPNQLTNYMAQTPCEGSSRPTTQEILRLLWKRMFVTVFTELCSVSWILFKIYFNIMLEKNITLIYIPRGLSSVQIFLPKFGIYFWYPSVLHNLPISFSLICRCLDNPYVKFQRECILLSAICSLSLFVSS